MWHDLYQTGAFDKLIFNSLANQHDWIAHPETVSPRFPFDDDVPRYIGNPCKQPAFADLSFVLKNRVLLEACKMVEITAGHFLMGSQKAGDSPSAFRSSLRKIQLTRDYSIGKYPVTQCLWESVMDQNPCDGQDFAGPIRPVVLINWRSAVKFCNKLSERQGFQPAYSIVDEEVVCDFDTNGYRLPTSAEWEFAAKDAGLSSALFTFAGSNNIDEVAWYRGNSGNRTRSVGQRKANQIGVFDLNGNVLEWCWDDEFWKSGTDPIRNKDLIELLSMYGLKKSGSKQQRTARLFEFWQNTTLTDPTGPGRITSRNRWGKVIRGGSYGSEKDHIGTSFPSVYPHTFGCDPRWKSTALGMRLCRTSK